MKNLKLNVGLMIILFTAINIFSLKTYANCQASFTWTQTANNVISLTNTSTGTDSCNSFLWNMGDGNYEYGQTPTHTYNDLRREVLRHRSLFQKLDAPNLR